MNAICIISHSDYDGSITFTFVSMFDGQILKKFEVGCPYREGAFHTMEIVDDVVEGFIGSDDVDTIIDKTYSRIYTDRNDFTKKSMLVCTGGDDYYQVFEILDCETKTHTYTGKDGRTRNYISKLWHVIFKHVKKVHHVYSVDEDEIRINVKKQIGYDIGEPDEDKILDQELLAGMYASKFGYKLLNIINI